MEPRLINKAGAAKFGIDLDSEITDTSTYELADLLRYHDERFVLNAYVAVAKRRPDSSELAQTLAELRSGLRTKTAVIEELVARHPNVRVAGLSSPTLRTISRLPLIGYIARVLHAIGRLPLLIQHQQHFEAYIVGQHQCLTDYVNEVAALTDERAPHIAIDPDTKESMSDAIKTVMMLSDSLIELSASVAEAEKQLQTLQGHQLELSTAIQKVQEQQQSSADQLHADLVALTNKLTEQQQRLSEHTGAHELAVASQRRFLIKEQSAIVEAQRVAVNELQEQLNQAVTQNSMRTAELTAEVCDLRAALEEFQQAAHQK